jgi:hypothetical protein
MTLEAEVETLVAAALGELEQDTELAALVATAAEEGRLHFGAFALRAGASSSPGARTGSTARPRAGCWPWQGRQGRDVHLSS